MTRTAATRPWRAIAVILVAIAVGRPSESGAQSPDSPLRISPEMAIEMALANNLSLEGARRGPEVADLNVLAARSAWKPEVLATLGHNGTDSPASTSFDRPLGTVTDREVTSNLSVNQQLPWGGHTTSH